MKKIEYIIPTILIKASYSYESEVDIPLPIIKKPIIDAFIRPDKVMSRIGDDGGEGGIGKLTTGLLQGGGTAAGGLASLLATPSKSKGTSKALATLIGSYLGLGTGGATAGLMHNSESKSQFSKALRGSLSQNDIPKIPSGILSLIDAGNHDKFKQMAPTYLPELMERPYVKDLLASQDPR